MITGYLQRRLFMSAIVDFVEGFLVGIKVGFKDKHKRVQLVPLTQAQQTETDEVSGKKNNNQALTVWFQEGFTPPLTATAVYFVSF